jgi:hypothetical protein
MRVRRAFHWTEQLLLFESPRVRPRWESVPAPARQEANQMMAKMLCEYAMHQGVTAQHGEGNHE